MKLSFCFLLVAFSMLLFVQEVSADSGRRGLITSGHCPLSCEDLRIPAKDCRESRAGDLCQVEDFAQPAGHRSLFRVPQKNYVPWSEQTAKKMKMKRRGLVTTAPCPYTCKDAGVPKHLCRESQAGNNCQVEDFTQPPGHRSMMRISPAAYRDWSEETKAKLKMERRGLITSSPCPYSCRAAGVPQDLCREWRAGNTCYVEDFTQPPGHRTRVPVRY